MYKNIWALLVVALSLNVAVFADTEESDAEVKENTSEEQTTTDSLLAADADESEEKKEEASPSFIG